MTKRSWEVHTHRQEHIQVIAELIEVRDNNALVFTDLSGVISHAFPAGAWVEVKEIREDRAWRT